MALSGSFEVNLRSAAQRFFFLWPMVPSGRKLLSEVIVRGRTGEATRARVRQRVRAVAGGWVGGAAPRCLAARRNRATNNPIM